ncbi:MAG: AAA family ATPase [Candidatus Omnitrophica bacterium]|nr:AAA family ATPase [Candidatus Omnitrophota bacterium]MBI2173847.1 AAA family ATPase [Candidatus Omnitrophota bacterium]MBI3009418.1 AAA family ATPase [Candidatus Omnitrophota bacterium]
MSYYQELGLTKEPFSTSPDPAFFFRSTSHLQALTRLEIAIRLRRGLCLILGDVGTGKTTLARTLLANFPQEDGFSFHVILDPSFESEHQFLLRLCRMFRLQGSFRSTLDCREAIEHYLFHGGVVEGKTTVLMIDEGQKLSLDMLENLRMLLNYETNEYKLLQVVIFGQMELLGRIRRLRNFMDRVALKYIINPLSEEETAQIIRFRLQLAGREDAQQLFTDSAIRFIHETTQGYPRQISLLCHNALEALVMYQKTEVDASLIQELIQHESRWAEAAA